MSATKALNTPCHVVSLSRMLRPQNPQIVVSFSKSSWKSCLSSRPQLVHSGVSNLAIERTPCDMVAFLKSKVNRVLSGAVRYSSQRFDIPGAGQTLLNCTAAEVAACAGYSSPVAFMPCAL